MSDENVHAEIFLYSGTNVYFRVSWYAISE